MGWVIASRFIGSSGSRLLIAVLVAVAAGLLVVAITVLLGRRQAKVERQLAGYELARAAKPSADGDGPARDRGRAAGDGDRRRGSPSAPGCSTKTEQLLEQADVPIRAGELLFYAPRVRGRRASCCSRCSSARSPASSRAVVVAIASVRATSNYRERAAAAAFEHQLPDTLTLLASSLRAGFSLMQGLEAVAQETADPMRKELQRVFTEVRLGRPIEDALGDAADRMDSNDLRVDRHGDPDPARGRWKPGRAARHRRRHDGEARARAPRAARAHRRRPAVGRSC